MLNYENIDKTTNYTNNIKHKFILWKLLRKRNKTNDKDHNGET